MRKREGCRGWGKKARRTAGNFVYWAQRKPTKSRESSGGWLSRYSSHRLMGVSRTGGLEYTDGRHKPNNKRELLDRGNGDTKHVYSAAAINLEGIKAKATSSRDSRRIPELDGIRGLAILMVVCVHMFYTPGYGREQSLAIIGRVFALGWSGVDLFFVLSGFLIGGILLDNRTSERYFRAFYARRFFRIIPVYYAWILLFVIMVKLGGGLLHANTRSGVVPEAGWRLLSQVFFLQNLWEQHYLKLEYWWFAPSWSLAVEEHFYLVAPLLVRYLPKRLVTAVLLAVIVAAPLLRYVLHMRSVAQGLNPNPSYRLTPCRADSLAVGMLLAYGWRSVRFREWLARSTGVMYAIFGMLLTLVLGMAWKRPSPNELVTQTIGYTVLACFFSMVILLAISRPEGILGKFFRLGFLRELGRVSYCMYLIHLAVGYVCFGVILKQIANFANWKSGAVGVLAIVLSYLIACVSWKVLEEPLLRLGHKYKF